MALTLSSATADVRQLLNEPTAVFWTDSEIEDWIKEGTRIIASKTLSVEADDDLTLVANQLIYTSSDHSWIGDCLEIYAAIYDNGSNKYKGLQMVHPKQIGNLLTFTAGDPRYVAFHNRSVYVWPLPTSAKAGNTISILYATETEDFTLLKDEFQHLAIIWAQARAMEKDHKYQTAMSLKQQFFSELDFERKDKTDREGEATQSVKTGQSTTKR
jgi:hypothetical protein